MKLYYAPGACSLSPHIVACEAGIPLELEKVDFTSGRTGNGAEFSSINPKGSVPALLLDNGEILTEGPVIAQYLADREPERGLAPAHGSLARYRLQEMLGFINSEVHKTYGALFHPVSPEVTQQARESLLRNYALLERRLAEQEDAGGWLMGAAFTVADAYLFTVTSWATHVRLDLSGFPAIARFQSRVASRPAVQAALREEGLA
jgi:glutathione S-transferase